MSKNRAARRREGLRPARSKATRVSLQIWPGEHEAFSKRAVQASVTILEESDVDVLRRVVDETLERLGYLAPQVKVGLMAEAINGLSSDARRQAATMIVMGMGIKFEQEDEQWVCGPAEMYPPLPSPKDPAPGHPSGLWVPGSDAPKGPGDLVIPSLGS